MHRSSVVFDKVNKLYQNSTTVMGKWMWRNHVQWTANKTRALAKKYHADSEKAYCAALLHDLADSRYERGHKDFVSWSEMKGKEILLQASFKMDEANVLTPVGIIIFQQRLKVRSLLLQTLCFTYKPASFQCFALCIDLNMPKHMKHGKSGSVKRSRGSLTLRFSLMTNTPKPEETMRHS